MSEHSGQDLGDHELPLPRIASAERHAAPVRAARYGRSILIGIAILAVLSFVIDAAAAFYVTSDRSLLAKVHQFDRCSTWLATARHIEALKARGESTGAILAAAQIIPALAMYDPLSQEGFARALLAGELRCGNGGNGGLQHRWGSGP